MPSQQQLIDDRARQHDQINYLLLSQAGTSTGEVAKIAIVASDALPTFCVATITGLRANSANTAHYGKVVGVTESNISVGFSGNVIVEGLLVNSGWAWTPGATIFLNGTALSMTAPSTGFTQEIGLAKASDTIYVDVSVPILL